MLFSWSFIKFALNKSRVLHLRSSSLTQSQLLICATSNGHLFDHYTPNIQLKCSKRQKTIETFGCANWNYCNCFLIGRQFYGHKVNFSGMCTRCYYFIHSFTQVELSVQNVFKGMSFSLYKLCNSSIRMFTHFYGS